MMMMMIPGTNTNGTNTYGIRSVGILGVCLHSRHGHHGHHGRPGPVPLFLPPQLPWQGAHSCLRGHIWPVVINAFVASQANVAITRFLVGQIIKYAQRIILGFGSNGPPARILTQMCSFKFLWFKSTWSTHFCHEFSSVAITRFLRGTFCQNLVTGGTKNI